VIRLLLLLLVLATGSVYLVRFVERLRRERLAQVRAAFLVDVRPRDRDPEHKDAVLRSGAVRMRLPQYWAEEHPDEDHASFREGRVLLRSLDASREDGRDVVVFCWLFAAPLPPSQARLATFTLSVPEKTALDPLTRDVVAMLDLEIRSARLA
jgi:rhodanese-related sulfurtransferase